VPITSKVRNLNHAHGEVYSIQHYVIRFVSDLRQVFSSYFAYVSTTDCHDITEILLKVAFITTNLSLTPFIIFQ